MSKIPLNTILNKLTGIDKINSKEDLLKMVARLRKDPNFKFDLVKKKEK